MIKRIIRDNVYLLIQYSGSCLIPLFLIPHIIKNIGLDKYGILVILMNFGVFISTLIQYAFNYLGPIELSKGNNSFYIESLIIKVIIFSVSALSMTFYVSIYLYEYLSYWIIVLLIPLAMTMNSVWYLQYRDKFLIVSIISLAGTALGVYIGIEFINQNFDNLSIALLSLLIPQFIMGFFTMVYSFWIYNFKKNFKSFNIKKIKYEIMRGKEIFLSQLVSSIYGLVGPLIIAILYNTENSGIYGAVEKINGSVVTVLLLTNIAAYPKLVNLYREGINSYINGVKQLIKIYMLLALLLIAVFITYSEYILIYLYGGQYKSMIIPSYIGIALIIFGIFGPILTGYFAMKDRGDIILKLTIFITIITLGFGFPLTYKYGAIGWMLAMIAGQLPLPFIMWKIFKNEIQN